MPRIHKLSFTARSLFKFSTCTAHASHDSHSHWCCSSHRMRALASMCLARARVCVCVCVCSCPLVAAAGQEEEIMLCGGVLCMRVLCMRAVGAGDASLDLSAAGCNRNHCNRPGRRHAPRRAGCRTSNPRLHVHTYIQLLPHIQTVLTPIHIPPPHINIHTSIL
jgi:hypothetical protein